MRVYERSNSSRFWIDLRIAGKRARFPGFTAQTTTRKLGQRVQQIAELGLAGLPLNSEQAALLQRLPHIARNLVKAGMLADRYHQTGDNSIPVAIEQYRAYLKGKENTSKHVDDAVNACRRLLVGIRATTLESIAAESVETWLADQRAADCSETPFGRCTRNRYLTHMRGLVRWAVRTHRLASDPLSALEKLNEATDPRRRRRALTWKEFTTLLDKTRGSAEHHHMTGSERATLYRLAVETGLRAGEIRSLTVESFDLEATPAAVRLFAGSSKRRKQDTIPWLSPGLAGELGELFATKLPTTLAFPGMPPVGGKLGLAPMLRADLGVAGIPYRTEPSAEHPTGQVADFHSLRHLHVTEVMKHLRSLRDVQHVARLSEPGLLARYGHPDLEEIQRGLADTPWFNMG